MGLKLKVPPSVPHPCSAKTIGSTLPTDTKVTDSRVAQTGANRSLTTWRNRNICVMISDISAIIKAILYLPRAFLVYDSFLLLIKGFIWFVNKMKIKPFLVHRTGEILIQLL